MAQHHNDDQRIEQSGRLAGGQSYRLSPTHLVIVDAAGATVMTIPVADITNVSRGGSELVLTRREADPVTLVFPTYQAARNLKAHLDQFLPTERPRRSRRWQAG